MGQRPTTKCVKCNRELAIASLNVHLRSCGISKDLRPKYPNRSHKAWNQGLTKNNNISILRQSEWLKSAYANGYLEVKGYYSKDYHGSTDHIKASKKGGGYKDGAGRSKKYKVSDYFGNPVCLQSSYEYQFYLKLYDNNIKWIRPKFLSYNDKKYFADFYLVDYDLYIDTKNDYLIKIDKEKINAVIQQNHINLIILNKFDIDNYKFAPIVQN